MPESTSVEVSFSEAIESRNWIELARSIDSLLANPEVSHRFSRRDVIARVAEGRGEAPRSIEYPFKAFRFLKSHFPNTLSNSTRIRCGYAPVFELEKLHRVAPELAEQSLTGVLDGKISGESLKRKRMELQNRLVEENPGTVSGRMGRSKIAQTERHFAEIIEGNVERFTGDPASFPDRNMKLGPITPDFVLKTSSGQTHVFEIKVGSSALTKWHYTNILGQLSLYERLGVTTWLVTPHEFEKAIYSISENAKTFRMKTKFATIDNNDRIRIFDENR